MSQVTAYLLVVVAALGGFYGGFRYEKGTGTASAAANSSTPKAISTSAPTTTGRSGATGAGGGTFTGAGGFAGGGAGRGGSAGTISNLSDKGFTLTMASGSSVTVTFGSSQPTVRKTADGSVADLQNGETVTVTGSRDSSNNLTAQQITIVPSATPGG